MLSDVYAPLMRRLKTALGGFRAAYLPILVTYFCYGASSVTAVALLYFEKETLKLTPAAAAGIAFWLGLPGELATLAATAFHGLSQVHDYALGLVAWMWIMTRRPAPPGERVPKNDAG